MEVLEKMKGEEKIILNKGLNEVYYPLVASLEEANAEIEKAKKEAMAKEAEVSKLMITIYKLRRAWQHQKMSSPRPNSTTSYEVRQVEHELVQTFGGKCTQRMLK